MTIVPDYGFGQILALQKKNLKILFNPQHEDSFSNELEGLEEKSMVEYELVVDTIKNMGGLRKVKRFLFSFLEILQIYSTGFVAFPNVIIQNQIL